MKKVVVILPTYNGEKYLRELLDSLYNQTYPLIEIYTRDDCSSDNTVKIIEEYSKKKVKGRKIIIVPNEGKNLGCPDCFIELLRKAKDGDYYCFCDQDDVWLPEKIENAVKKIENESNKDIPTLHFGAYDFCTEKLEFVHHSFKVFKNIKLRNLIYDFWPLGFNITFNKRLYDVVFNNMPKHIYYHDSWFAQVAAGVGRFLYSNESSVKYRRQESAVTYSNHNKFSLFIWRIKRFFGDNDNLITLKNILVEYKEIFGDRLSEEDKKMLDIFTIDNFTNYFKKIFYPHRLRTKLSEEIALRLVFIIGKL